MRMNLFADRLQKTHRRSAIRVHTKIRHHKWAEQPTPHGALVIRAVTLPNAAAVMPLVAGFVLRQTAQSVRSNESPGKNVDNGFMLFRGERALRQRNCKNLIWSKRGVVSYSRRVDDVVAVSGSAIPEFGEAFFCARR